MLQHDSIQPSPSPPELARDQICEGLRALADFLGEQSGVPVGALACQITEFVQAADDAAGIAEVNRVAAILGVPAAGESASGGHYQAVRMFDPVRYRIIYVSTAARATHDAWASYYGSVTTADEPDSLTAAPAAA